MTTTDPPETRSSSYTPRTAKWTIGLIVVFVLLMFGPHLLSLLSGPGRPGRRGMCINKLHNLSIALLNYESTHGTFPPAYVADKDGEPLYSWRVLLLPYIERADLYEQFHLDEPWDSPHNLPLSKINLQLFNCPGAPSSEAGTTDYVMVVGPGMISEGAKSHGLKDITDGPGNTILLVEMASSGIHWAEPRDLDVSNATVVPPDSDKPGLRSWHPGGVIVSFADGRQHFLDEDIDPKLLHALLTTNGGEDVSKLD